MRRRDDYYHAHYPREGTPVMTRLIFAGWLLVVLVAAFTPDWLVGSGSLLGSLLPGSQGNPGYEGIEAVLVLGTLPVLVGIARRDAA